VGSKDSNKPKQNNIDALSHRLDEYQFDLTAIDEVDGQTVLHKAIAHGHDQMVRMLLGRAGNDPLILDAKNRCDRATCYRHDSCAVKRKRKYVLEIIKRDVSAHEQRHHIGEVTQYFQDLGPIEARDGVPAGFGMRGGNANGDGQGRGEEGAAEKLGVKNRLEHDCP
jgi:hypothetical protein